MSRKRVAVLASGRGSNLQALIKACADPAFPAEIVCVLVNRPGAKALDHARNAGIAELTLDHTAFEDRDAFDQALDEILREQKIDLICLAGFMRLLGSEFVSRWRNRLINIHPSLLPAYRGLDTHERVLEDGVRFTGATVHFVRSEMDTGPIIIQAVVPVLPDDTPQELAQRVLEQEHRIYPLALKWLASGKATVRGDKVLISDAKAADTSLINPA